MSNDDEKADTFGSAWDLPQVKEIVRELRDWKSLRFVMSAEQKAELSRSQSELTQMVDVVDRFYDLLGSRNWVFHGDMNLGRIRSIVDTEDPAEAERRLIAYYQDEEVTKFLFTRLFRVEAFRPRLPMITRAYADYLAGRHYACVLALIAVLDGAVSDMDKATGHGLHTRSPEEMVAWDSVTAHHLGLKHTQKTFTKSFRKTREDEVFELYRHGIVHGRVINFDNEIVSTKAINQLFAVADWAEALSAPRREESTPTLAEMQEIAKDLARANEINDTFQPSDHASEDSELADNVVYIASQKLLEYWQNKNYGGLSTYFPKFPGGSVGRRAGQAKDLYGEFKLGDFTIKGVHCQGSILTTVDVHAQINGVWKDFVLRWVQMDEQAQPVLPGKPGEWVLAPHGPLAFLKSTST